MLKGESVGVLCFPLFISENAAPHNQNPRSNLTFADDSQFPEE